MSPPARWLVPGLTLAVFANHLNTIGLAPFLPVVADELDVSVALLGQVAALMLLLTALFGLVIGPLADRYGYRGTLLLGLLAVVASSLITGLAPTLPVLLLAALVGAVGRATVSPVGSSIVVATFSDDAARRRALSRTQHGGPLAAVVGVPLLTTIAAALHWRGAFVALAGLTLGIALILWLVLPREAAENDGRLHLKDVLVAFAPVVRQPSTRTLIVAACLENSGVVAMWTYYGAFYGQQHRFTTQEVGWVSLAAGLGVLLGQAVVGGRLGGHPRALLIAGCTGSGPLVGLSLIFPLPALDAVLLMAMGWVMHGLVMVSTVVLLVGETRAGRATTLTLYGSAMTLGGALGGALGGLALTLGGYLALGLCTLALALIAAVIVWCLYRPEASPISAATAHR